MNENAVRTETIKALETARRYCSSDAYVKSLAEFTQADVEVKKLKKRFRREKRTAIILIVAVGAAFLLSLLPMVILNARNRVETTFCEQYPTYVTVNESGGSRFDAEALKAAEPDAYERYKKELSKELSKGTLLALSLCTAVVAAGTVIGYALCWSPRAEKAQDSRLGPYIERRNQGATVCIRIYNTYAKDCNNRNEYPAISWTQFDVETIDMLLDMIRNTGATTIPECWAAIESMQYQKE